MTNPIAVSYDDARMPRQYAGPTRRAGYDEIAACADVYRDAMRALDLATRLGASEDVLRARLALAACLMDAGWQPTGPILATIHRDEELLRESNGALDGLLLCRPE